jgi:hypothetical protein
MGQYDARTSGNIKPEGIEAADGMRQGKIEEQDCVKREQSPNQGETLAKVFSGKFVGDQENAEKTGHQPGTEVT